MPSRTNAVRRGNLLAMAPHAGEQLLTAGCFFVGVNISPHPKHARGGMSVDLNQH